jgi:hypothetical protein
MSDVKQDWLQRLRADHTKERTERWIENYMARVNVGQSGPAASLGLKGPAERYDAAMKRAHRVRARTEAFLDQLDVPKVDWPAYWGYACKLERIKDNVLGEQTLRQEAGVLIMTWEAKGLKRDVMIQIARELFELELSESTNQG